ncbi:choline dehydrogenase [Pseudonocardia lacus]|uniref:choline dehydrogenase n=1 Tax=Pseudonocardia lacus TaxID=2835865 RepID=UPI001BDC9C90|nr:choline dehydrogenase [Pseudonocardia lacus]
MSNSTYDFVIVGGGAAGCALANRLSADPGNQVLLLEAGMPDYPWDVLTHMPAAMGIAISTDSHNWKYVSEPEPHMKNRQMPHPRGKLLGGSGSINAMNFMRGHPSNFEKWAEHTGTKDWDNAHVLPYFKRVETSLSFGDSEFRGNHGPHVLTRAALDNPLFDVFFSAAQQGGYKLTTDFNGARQEGFSAFERFIVNGKRRSSSQAYLRPVQGRKNLTVRTHAYATKIVFAGTRATGVVYRGKNGTEYHVSGGEIVLCGGSFNSPQLLQLSGVGNADELKDVGITPIHHLPGVGENLEDHLAVQVQHASTQPISMIAMKNKLNWPGMGLKWLAGKGEATSNMFEAAGFVRSNEDREWPDVILVFAAMAMAFDPDKQVEGHGYQLHVGTMSATSRGFVKIASADPMVHPRIRMNYLSTQRDRDDWVKALRLGRELLEQPAFKEIDGGEVVPGPHVQTDEELLDWVASKAQTGLHPSGTCRMGHGENEVVDPGTLRVHGLDGLRVVDASVFPTTTNAQIYAPVMMVAEKGADIILGNTPLAPEYPEYDTTTAVRRPRPRPTARSGNPA